MKLNEKSVSDLQKMHEADLDRIKKFCLLDDDFMSKVFEDLECAEIDVTDDEIEKIKTEVYDD